VQNPRLDWRHKTEALRPDFLEWELSSRLRRTGANYVSTQDDPEDRNMPIDRMNGAILEPVTQRFIDALVAAGEPPVYTLSPTDARATLTRAQSVPIGKPDARIEDATYPVGPKGSVRVRIVHRRTPSASSICSSSWLPKRLLVQARAAHGARLW
jgi:hypothetical protein